MAPGGRSPPVAGTTVLPDRDRAITKTTPPLFVLDPDGHNIEGVCHDPA